MIGNLISNNRAVSARNMPVGTGFNFTWAGPQLKETQTVVTQLLCYSLKYFFFGPFVQKKY
jgi:hypothetical protein